jgi:hypothetical protein
MTEQTFIDLGFERNDVPVVESGDNHDFYYYTLDIGDICLITNADDEANQNGWEVYIFDSMTMRIKGAGDLEDLIRILKNNVR